MENVAPGLVIAAWGAQTLRISVPYLLAATGGSFSERAGVVNIALEGLILTGAFACAWGGHVSGSPWVGVLAAMAAGLLVAALHGVVSLTFRGDHIVSGLGINILAAGATRFGLRVIFGSSSNSARVPTIPELELPFLRNDVFLKTLFCTPLVTLSVAAVVLSYLVQQRTAFGLRLRAVGENPRAAEAAGLRVQLLRYTGVLISGALAALAGAWMTLSHGSFSDGMSGGRGYIALAALIVGRWHPLGAAAAALFFGAAETLEIRLQGGPLPSQFIQLIPYAATMIVLIGLGGRTRPPAALGRAYSREE